MFDHSRDDLAVTIRRAAPADARALEQLAALDAAPRLTGDVIVAEVSGELWAARSLASGRLVSDPFRPTAEVAALLALRAGSLSREVTLRRLRRFRVLRRAAT
jgi:hypothetical protein